MQQVGLDSVKENQWTEFPISGVEVAFVRICQVYIEGGKTKRLWRKELDPNAVTHERQGYGETTGELYFTAEHKKTKADKMGARGKVATKRQDKVQRKTSKFNSNIRKPKIKIQ